ncbi:MAG TPA: hydrogenase 3 maturation endopeptidase HyCI [Sedimentisphaerales bacterium]|nr:hydrogenase 3 maturation endopeptidase HyCI [Sedimentisphaerales bacterium]
MIADRELVEQLDGLRGSRTLIVGIGNTLKGDDGAGPLVCERLKRLKISADLIDAGTVPENYIRPIVKKAPKNLLVVDAMDFGARAGMVGIFEPEQLHAHAFSTHALWPGLFVEMIRRDLDVDVRFVGIQPAQTQFGQTVSPPVDEAIQQLCRVLAEIFPPG